MQGPRILYAGAMLFAVSLAAGGLFSSAAGATSEPASVHPDGAVGGFHLTVEPERAVLVGLSLPKATTCELVLESAGHGFAVWYGGNLDQPRSVETWTLEEGGSLLSVGTLAGSRHVEWPAYDDANRSMRSTSRASFDAGEHHLVVGSDPRGPGDFVAVSVACKLATASVTLLAEGEPFLADHHEFHMLAGLAFSQTLLASIGGEVRWESEGPWLAGVVTVLSAGDVRGSFHHGEMMQTFQAGVAHDEWYVLVGAHADEPMPVRVAQDAVGVQVDTLVWAVSWNHAA